MNNISQIIWFFLLLMLSLIGFFMVVRALFPSRVDRTRQVISSLTGRAFWVGLVNAIFLLAIILVLVMVTERLPDGARWVLFIPTILLSGVLLVMLAFGLTGTVALVGERLLPEYALWQQMLWATVLSSLACALPFVGWFLLLPYLALVGIGSFLLSFFQRGPVVTENTKEA